MTVVVVGGTVLVVVVEVVGTGVVGSTQSRQHDPQHTSLPNTSQMVFVESQKSALSPHRQPVVRKS